MTTGKAIDGMPHAALFGIARRSFIAMASAALLAFGGCTMLDNLLCDKAPPLPAGGSEEAWKRIAEGANVRVAVYVGPGARGVGAFRWAQLVASAKGIDWAFVDGQSIRDGALRNADVIVMPGGKSHIEAESLGAEGRAELRRFIEEGGSYVGTCAGAFLLLGGGTPENKRLGIVPFKPVRGEWGGAAMLQVEYAKEAAAASGIKAGARMERFNGGPVMTPSDPVPGADFKVMSRFKCNLHSFSARRDLPSMGGYASAVAGTFGRGRVWVFATHPEYALNTWSSVSAAFKFVTGREFKFTAPQRKKGQLAVGFWCAPSMGVYTARIAHWMATDDTIDLVPCANNEVKRTDLRHLDAFVVPDTPDVKFMQTLTPDSAIMRAFTRFMDRGGKVFTWGAAAKKFKPHVNLVVEPDGAGAWTDLNALKLKPPPRPRASPAPKNVKPVRAAVYFDIGAGGAAAVRWIKMLSLSPDCEFFPVSAADVRNGALKNADLYVAPGGDSGTQADVLKECGRSNVVEFVRGGGGYFGTCAGLYLILSRAADDKFVRLGMLPYVRQRSHYRGGADLTIKFTKDAGLFGLKPGVERTVRYHGGPVLLPSKPVPGADMHEIALYACDGVYASNTSKKPVMAHTPAIVAGTFGKGRVAGTSPHPESYVNTQDIIRGGLKYVTGREIKAEYPQRTRGNLSVGFHGANIRKDGATLAARLFREPSLDVRAVGEDVNFGALEHCDVLVMCHPSKKHVTSLVRDFAANGGTLLLLGSEKEFANVPSDWPNVVKCRDVDSARASLLRISAE